MGTVFVSPVKWQAYLKQKSFNSKASSFLQIENIDWLVDYKRKIKESFSQ